VVASEVRYTRFFSGNGKEWFALDKHGPYVKDKPGVYPRAGHECCPNKSTLLDIR